jgi:hypothetical protein
MSLRIPLDEWDTLTEELRRFGRGGDVTVTADRIRIDFGAAHVVATRDGTLNTGMPLHDFAHDDAAAVVLDHDDGTLAVDADGVTYTFRRPGG